MRGDENIRGKVFWVLNTYLHALSFRFRSTDETGRHLQTRFLGSGKMQKKTRLRPSLGRKCISGVFRARGTCLVTATSFSPLVKANSALPNHLAEFCYYCYLKKLMLAPSLGNSCGALNRKAQIMLHVSC